MARTTRWEDVPNRGYGPKFGELIREGADVDGEARLADALITRHSTVLDAGSGMGRVAAALVARGAPGHGSGERPRTRCAKRSHIPRTVVSSPPI
ncbi:MAG: hypothetical protein V9E81_10605 [Marmoricola sp.]